MGISRTDLKCVVPEGYTATFTFRQKSSNDPISYLVLTGGKTYPSFYASAPALGNDEKTQLTFGEPRRFTTVRMTNHDKWRVVYPDSKIGETFNLFEVWAPTVDGPLYWCDVLIKKEKP